MEREKVAVRKEILWRNKEKEMVMACGGVFAREL